MTDLTVNIEKTIEAPIEQVFDAWLTAETLAKFILPMPGMKAPLVKNDPKVEGTFEIIMFVGDDKVPHTGTYLELDRPNKLAFTWESPASLSDSVVTLEFTEINKNTTKIELTQVKFKDEECRSNHEGGWTNILNELEQVVC